MNQATQTLISAVEKLAAQEERTSEEIMQDVMSDPKTLFPMLFTAENLKELVPQNMEPVRLSDGAYVPAWQPRYSPPVSSCGRQCIRHEALRAVAGKNGAQSVKVEARAVCCCDARSFEQR